MSTTIRIVLLEIEGFWYRINSGELNLITQKLIDEEVDSGEIESFEIYVPSDESKPVLVKEIVKTLLMVRTDQFLLITSTISDEKKDTDDFLGPLSLNQTFKFKRGKHFLRGYFAQCNNSEE